MSDFREVWESVGGDWANKGHQQFWREMHNAVNRRLIQSWSSKPVDRRSEQASQPRRVMKTDLFDEMTSSGLIGDFDQSTTKTWGLDLSVAVCSGAIRLNHGLTAVSADVRNLPFATDSFSLVVSNSTLDHFDHFSDVETSLREIFRTLQQGGELIVTMDNPWNPVVALRNALPFRLLNRLGLLPYPVGATCGPRRLRRSLIDAGFEVVDSRAISHLPRVLGVWCAAILFRLESERFKENFRKFVLGAEALNALPTRYFSGYYVAMLARKPSAKRDSDQLASKTSSR